MNSLARRTRYGAGLLVLSIMAPMSAFAADWTCVRAPVGTGIYASATEASPSYGTLPRPERMTVQGEDGGRLRVGRRGVDNPAYPMFVDAAAVSVVACIGGQDTGRTGETLLRRSDPAQEYIDEHAPPALAPALTWVNGVATAFNDYLSVSIFGVLGIAYAMALAVLMLVRVGDCRKGDVPRLMTPIALGALFSTNILPFLFHTLFAINYLLIATMMIVGLYYPRSLKSDEWKRGLDGSWVAAGPFARRNYNGAEASAHVLSVKSLMDRRRAFGDLLRASAWWAASNVIAIYSRPLFMQIWPTIERAMPAPGQMQGSALAVGLLLILGLGGFLWGVVLVFAVATEYFGWIIILMKLFSYGRYLAAEIAFRKTWAKVSGTVLPASREINPTAQQTQGASKGKRRVGDEPPAPQPAASPAPPPRPRRVGG